VYLEEKAADRNIFLFWLYAEVYVGEYFLSRVGYRKKEPVLVFPL